MADMNRRKGGVRSQQSYMQQAAASQQQQQFSPYQQQLQAQAQAQAQQNPYQYQQYQKQQQQSKAPGFHPNRSGGYRSAAATARPGAPPTAGAKMGIKSGMTVEDLKRLTQKRMQQSSNPATPKATAPEGFSSSRPATPKINMAVVNATSTPAAVATPPVIPKTGMSVQELKQLTAMRVASQNAPVHASEVTGLVSKAVLNNAAKSHYRDSMRSSLTPGSTPKRSHHTRSSSSTQFGSAQYGGFGNQTSDLSRSHGPSDLSRSHGPLSSGMSGDVIPVRGHRSRSRSSQLPNVDSSVDNMPMRYSYTSGQTPEDYFSTYDFGGGGNSTSSQETDPGRGSFDDAVASSRSALLQFPEDSFPPPPPMDESGGFVSTALPSWSPPPTRTKKLNASASSGATFYNQQTSYYNIASKDESASANDSRVAANETQDQNAVLAPPPGLTRRPSMTVPWQVAESVLNTPQTNTGRKKLLDSDADTNSVGLNTSAAEAAAQLTGLSLQSSTRSRGNSGAQPPASSSSVTLSSSPSSSGSIPQSGGASAARRGSFGNAAEFFKFRRRSKSRLELARDLSFGDNGELGGYPSYGTAGAMPGIAERHGDAEDGIHEDSASDASSSTSANDESSSQDYTDEDVVQVTGGYDDTAEISGSFVSFYNASRQQQGGLSALSIPPPPPPPPMTDDEDDASTTSSTKGNGLPMMSPNGARLRKVAELARRGSLSSEDKTRAKDEIIQSSLGIGANNAARLLATKKEDRGDRVPATAPSIIAPPGFPGMGSSVPPRTTPKASGKKMLAPGSGIVRSSTAAPSSTSSGASAAPGASPASQKTAVAGNSSLEERLAAAAQRVADCVGKGDMAGFQQAMDELDWLRNEASKLMRG
ncbi:hypothetical protein KRP22_003417 [Phytophthora ramorum]|nr:hypothetical protein KRP22_9347 [Phytophthora ramorum]